MHPLVAHALKTAVSPEIFAEYGMAHSIASKVNGVPTSLIKKTLLKGIGTRDLNTCTDWGAKSTPHSPLDSVTQGVQNYAKGRRKPSGFLGGALNFLDSNTITNAEAASTKYKVMTNVARGATAVGGVALTAAGVPVLGEHTLINSARSMIGNTDAGYNATRSRILDGASGARESGLKRFAIDHLISPGVGASRDIGAALKGVPNFMLKHLIPKR